tara:strand:- start:233 stop:733 length:501 start_codon:yes stop_codon:yes gene_type:complete
MAKLNKYSVQEATNLMAQRKVIRVSPTLQDAATDSGDVAWNGTEIPNAVLTPGGCSKLVRMQIVNYTDTTCDFDIIFTQNTATIGTVDSAISISDADLKVAKLLGIISIDASATEIDLINGLTSYDAPTNGILLQASAGSSSVYFSGIDKTGADVDDLEFIFHIEY